MNGQEQNRKYSGFWSILAIFGPLGPPCWVPRGLRSRVSFSTNFSALDECKNNENFIPEINGGKIKKIHDFGRFWPFLVLWGPHGVP